MNIQEIRDFCKSLLQNDELFTAALLILVGLASFGLGRHSVLTDGAVPERTAGAVEMSIDDRGRISGSNEELEPVEAEENGAYVGSKNSDKYHLPWCSGAQRISEENKVWFATKAEAKAAGYIPAANCKGI